MSWQETDAADEDEQMSSTVFLNPEGPSAQYLRTLVPKAIKGMIVWFLEPIVLEHWVLGPSGEPLNIHTRNCMGSHDMVDISCT